MLFLMYTNEMISDTFKGAFFSSCISSSRRLQSIPRSSAESKKSMTAGICFGQRFARGFQPREERAVRPSTEIYGSNTGPFAAMAPRCCCHT